MMQYLLENNMASMLIDKGDPLNKTEQELILQEDSQDGLETTENNSVTFWFLILPQKQIL